MDREDFSQSSLDPSTPNHIESFMQWFMKKTAACFFFHGWRGRKLSSSGLWKLHPCTGTMVILLNLLSGTSPNLSSFHFKNLQMHPPHIYALTFICKEVATEMRHLIKEAYNYAVYMMTDLFRSAFILSSGPPVHDHTGAGYLSRFKIQSVWDMCANWHLSVKTIT